jgi:hypothetical protein
LFGKKEKKKKKKKDQISETISHVLSLFLTVFSVQPGGLFRSDEELYTNTYIYMFIIYTKDKTQIKTLGVKLDKIII